MCKGRDLDLQNRPQIKKMENMLELIQNTLQPIYLMDVENMSKLIYEYSFPVFNKNCECNYFKKWWGCCYVADKRKKFKKNINLVIFE